MGRFAMGTRALGNSLGFDVNVFSDAPGPQRMKAWKLVAGKVACGILSSSLVLKGGKEGGGTIPAFNCECRECESPCRESESKESRLRAQTTSGNSGLTNETP